MLFWGEAEARVAFMPLSGIRCDRVAEREGSRHFQSLEEKSSGLFVFVLTLANPVSSQTSQIYVTKTLGKISLFPRISTKIIKNVYCIRKIFA